MNSQRENGISTALNVRKKWLITTNLYFFVGLSKLLIAGTEIPLGKETTKRRGCWIKSENCASLAKTNQTAIKNRRPLLSDFIYFNSAFTNNFIVADSHQPAIYISAA